MSYGPNYPDQFRRTAELVEQDSARDEARRYSGRAADQIRACGYPHKPLVSYRINRQLSGWNLPPLMIRAFGAHCQTRTSATIAEGRPGMALPTDTG
jgi:hypothetical protein